MLGEAPKLSMPFQAIEAVHDICATSDKGSGAQSGLLDFKSWRESDVLDAGWRNKLIWGDNKLVMHALLEEFRGKIDLIYIDPPFATGLGFSFLTEIGACSNRTSGERTLLKQTAYCDVWGTSLDSYIAMMNERLRLMYELLGDSGALFLHCDWRANAYMRVILDDIFGRDCFRNEIIWRRAPNLGGQAASNQLGRVFDTIFVFTKRPESQFHWTPPVKSVPLDTNKDGVPKGKMWDPIARAYFTAAPRGDYTDESVDMLRKENRVYESSTGTVYIKYFLRQGEDGRWYKDSRVDAIWDDYDVRPLRNCPQDEDFDYDTQKPEGLLTRIIQWASRPGQLVADFFCGSGTTIAVSEKLGRRWIGCDVSRHAIHVSRKRIIQVQRELHVKGQPYRPFDVYNLERYERKWWQIDHLKGVDAEHRRLVLKFNKATELKDSVHPLLHGRKDTAYVHVASVESVFTFETLRAVAEVVRQAGGREVHCLAWEFEMGLSRKKEALAAETGLTIHLKYIPREIMEPNRTEVQFFEVGVLDAKPVVEDGKVDVELVCFAPGLAEELRAEMAALRERTVRSPFDFIDFWAVDFDYSPDKPFEYHWQDFRTRKDRSLKIRTDIGWQYETPDKHRIAVKVIDVFGVDTMEVLEVEA